MNAINDLMLSAFGDLISAILSIPVTIFIEALVTFVNTLIGGAA